MTYNNSTLIYFQDTNAAQSDEISALKAANEDLESQLREHAGITRSLL